MTTGPNWRRWHVERWFAVRDRGLGMWAYALNRVAGHALVLYLFLHLVILSQLAGGPRSWNTFLAIAKSPVLLTLDVVLIAGVLVHGLNGLRLSLVGMGLAVGWQKQLFVGLMLVALVTTGVSALKIFGVV